MPADSRPTDLWHWQTTLVVYDVEAAAVRFQGMTTFVSTGVVTVPDNRGGSAKRLLIRDPDGHALQLISP